MDIAAVVILALVMFYAGQRYAHRNLAKDAVAEAATRRNYVEEDRAAARRGET
ncbi:MAG: hypothetical protein ACJ8EL_06515 [Rhizomicrobium sp.]|jgi:hypothetical protein